MRKYLSFVRQTILMGWRHGPRVFLHRLLYKLRRLPGQPDMLLAHRYCKGHGIELGAAAYNSFRLENCLNVAPYSDDPTSWEYKDFKFFKDHQMTVLGYYTPVDLPGSAINIPVEESSQDYVISSHVVEHLPNLIGAFVEWNRVLKPSGVVFMIFPKRNALPSDIGRPITPLSEFVEDYQNDATFETHPIPKGAAIGGHYHVFTLESMLQLIAWCNDNLNLEWEVIHTEQSDSKNGNGHTVVCRKR